jgi:Ca-activated chloride channel family protein
MRALRHLLARAAVLALAVPSVASAQGWIDQERTTTAPPPARWGPVVRVASQVRVVVEDRIARVEVEERFRNDGGRVAEGSYLYPLPGEAVFQNFSLWAGDQELKGEMLDAAQARTIYETIVRQQRDPALLTLAGHGLIRAQVFPIQPGETRKVVLRYTVTLARTGDALRLRYALGQRGGTAGTDMRITLRDADRFGTPYSPTHALDVTRRGRGAELALPSDAAGDVELLLPLRTGAFGTTVLTHAAPGDDGTFMLVVAPPAETVRQRMPRAVTLVVDVSGSMSGAKIIQAREALRQAVQSLDASDRFRIIAFSSRVQELRDGWTTGSEVGRAEAERFIASLEAEGGTNIEAALDAAFRESAGEDRLPLVIFVTDGQPSVGETRPEQLAARAASGTARTRVFTVGIGHDVNTYLLERLAAEGRGSSEFVRPEQSVEIAMGSLLAKLQRPALTNLRIVEAPVPLRQLEPRTLPDLFHGEELVVVGRYDGSGRGPLVIEGERNGRRERITATVEFPRRSDAHDWLPRLWANRRAGTLTRQIRLEGTSPALMDELKTLALRYGVLTEYTSYLVQEPGVVVAQDVGRPQPRGGRRLPATSSMTGGNAVPEPMAPPPPAMQSGAQAFEAAKASADLREARSLASADAATNRRLREEAAARGTTLLAERQRGRRRYVQRGSVWTDLAHADSLPVVQVEAFSEAYFQLLRALPELAADLQDGDEVLVAGRAQSVRVGAAGVRRWSAGELDRIVRSFRGA